MGVCRVVRNQTISPELIDTARLAEQTARARASDHEAIRRHAEEVRARLVEAGALNAEGRVSAAQVRLRIAATP